MNISQFDDRVSTLTTSLNSFVNVSRYFTSPALMAIPQDLIPRLRAELADAIAERQEVIDDPNRMYWRHSTRIRPQMLHFTQLRYLPFSTSTPDLDIALNAINRDCGSDIRRMIEGYGAAKVWLTVQVRYEPANPKDEKNKAFEFFLSCAPTRFFYRDIDDEDDRTPYAQPLQELCTRIKELNAKFIREMSGLVLAGILQLVIRGVRYIPLAGRCFRELPTYLKNKKAIINIQNNDDRCFGYALLYFLRPP